MNKVIISGRLCKDVELKYTQNQKAFTKNCLAVDGYKDETDFINIVGWEKTAEFINKYLSKGRKVLVEGRISVRKWVDESDQAHWTTEVICTNVEFADSKPNTNSDSKPNSNGDFVPPQVDDDDLPF